MTPEATAAAARELISARRERRILAGLPAACRPATAAEGYEVQRAYVASWGEPVGGWKAGATALPVQQRFGLDEPFLGPIFASTILASPAKVKAEAYEHRALAAGARPGVALEVEFAFRLARDLPARPAPYSDEEVLGAVDALLPAIELIALRFAAIPFESPGSAIADCGVNGGLVCGAPVTAWRGLDYANHATRLIIDGKTVAEGTGSLVLGHPFKSLIWLINGLSKRGFSALRGQALTTGSMTGIVYADQGTAAVGDFGSLGRVEIAIT